MTYRVVHEGVAIELTCATQIVSALSPAAELDRVGVSYGKAGIAAYVWALDLGELVDLLGAPRIQPRPHWRGSKLEALALLTPAGPERLLACLRICSAFEPADGLPTIDLRWLLSRGEAEESGASQVGALRCGLVCSGFSFSRCSLSLRLRL